MTKYTVGKTEYFVYGTSTIYTKYVNISHGFVNYYLTVLVLTGFPQVSLVPGAYTDVSIHAYMRTHAASFTIRATTQTWREPEDHFPSENDADPTDRSTPLSGESVNESYLQFQTAIDQGPCKMHRPYTHEHIHILVAG